ncbi:phosphoribosylanthranilate isomerase [Aurantivibrio plasticivorans]
MSSFARVKICGITSVADAMAVAQTGADAIGLNFYEQSPRYISISTAQEIVRAVGPFVSVVGLFVNASQERVSEVAASVDLNMLQFHGDETEAYCSQFNLPYIKALRVRSGDPNASLSEVRAGVKTIVLSYQSASGVLLDAYSESAYGGTGEQFNWQAVPELHSGRCENIPLILAGGLTAGNVGEAIQGVEPYAVDVSSGIEISPGIKDLDKVREFVINSHGWCVDH